MCVCDTNAVCVYVYVCVCVCETNVYTLSVFLSYTHTLMYA